MANTQRDTGVSSKGIADIIIRFHEDDIKLMEAINEKLDRVLKHLEKQQEWTYTDGGQEVPPLPGMETD